MFVKLKRFCHDSFSATWLNAFSYSTSSSCDLCATATVKMSHSPTCWREKKRVQLQFSPIVTPPRSEQSCKVLAAITRPCAGVLQVWGGSLLSLTSPQTFPSTFWTSPGASFIKHVLRFIFQFLLKMISGGVLSFNSFKMPSVRFPFVKLRTCGL